MILFNYHDGPMPDCHPGVHYVRGDKRNSPCQCGERVRGWTTETWIQKLATSVSEWWKRNIVDKNPFEI